MENFQSYWDNNYSNKVQNKVVYDDWLDRFKTELSSCKTKILDLGCGMGNDTLYLSERGFQVLSCDYSSVALNILKQNIPSAETLEIDISQKLPFQDNSFDVVVADLCLHYFDSQTTKSVMNEIKRVLTAGGCLIARVNSTKDINFGAGQGVWLEENYYLVSGYKKRFFTVSDAKNYFSIVGEVQVEETQMMRYGKTKECLVVMAKKVN